MESNVKNPVWKLVLSYILGIVLLILVALMSGCGTRKIGVEINKSSETSKDKSDSKGQVKIESGSQTANTSVQQNNKVDEKQEQRITELYDENGKLKSRITELMNSKKTDNSSKTKSSTKVVYLKTDSIFNNTVYKTRTVKQYEKHKETESSNKQWAWVAGILGVIGLAFWLKPWK